MAPSGTRWGDGEPTLFDGWSQQPSSARLYDYFLGGKDNYAPDRRAARKVLDIFPVDVLARENRAFMHRAARFLAAEAGVAQFLDVGTGIPTSPNLHEVVQAVVPAGRVVYVDHDPVVLAHARVLMTGVPEGRTSFVRADLREPEAIFGAPELRQVLDLRRPVALSLIAVLHFLTERDDPHALVRRLMGHLPGGSWLMLSHVTGDLAPEEIAGAVRLYERSGIAARVRTRVDIEGFFDGLEPVDPGLVPVHLWRAEQDRHIRLGPEVSCYGAVARKP